MRTFFIFLQICLNLLMIFVCLISLEFNNLKLKPISLSYGELNYSKISMTTSTMKVLHSIHKFIYFKVFVLVNFCLSHSTSHQQLTASHSMSTTNLYPTKLKRVLKRHTGSVNSVRYTRIPSYNSL